MKEGRFFDVGWILLIMYLFGVFIFIGNMINMVSPFILLGVLVVMIWYGVLFARILTD